MSIPQSVAILGGGEAGVASALLAKWHGSEVFISDHGEIQAHYRSELQSNNIPFEENGHDLVMRGAPHALIISEPAEAPCPEQDVSLTLAYFELLAQSAGFGTVWCGMLKHALEAAPELKDCIGLPRDHVYYPIMFGKPVMKYSRTVQRDSVAKINRVSILV